MWPRKQSLYYRLSIFFAANVKQIPILRNHVLDALEGKG